MNLLNWLKIDWQVELRSDAGSLVLLGRYLPYGSFHLQIGRNNRNCCSENCVYAIGCLKFSAANRDIRRYIKALAWSSTRFCPPCCYCQCEWKKSTMIVQPRLKSLLETRSFLSQWKTCQKSSFLFMHCDGFKICDACRESPSFQEV